MSELYNGGSDSFGFITQCYLDYANEVICRRALPDLRDGLKVSTRRILYSAYMNKTKELRKCIPIVADAVTLHPHGDQSVYSAFTLMTDENGSCNVPMFNGLGNLGKVYLSRKPADMRYPKAKVSENIEDLFKDKEVMELVPAEEGVGMEPKVLNAIYPLILINGTMGIAVSVGTKIPSFNFSDVIDLTIKYLRNGSLEITDIIDPDFPTGGILVKNDTELAKIMKTGSGKLKIRARVEIEGKDILVKEVPYEKTVESMLTAIKNADIREITYAANTEGRDSKALLTIECRSKAVVDYVLKELYRRNILQTSYAANIVVTENEVPYMLGVHGIIERWCAWRQGVVKRKFTELLRGINEKIPVLDYFIRLTSNPEWKAEYIRRSTGESKASADKYLCEIFPDIPREVCNWISERAITAFNRGGKYAEQLKGLLAAKAEYEYNLANPKDYIINELQELVSQKGNKFPRKTEITYTDYKFSRVVEEEEEDTSECIYTLLESGFLMKTRDRHPEGEVNGVKVLCEFNALANEVLIGFDNYGRLVRFAGKEIPYTMKGELGEYLPKLLGAVSTPNYRVLYLGVLDGSTRMLVYSDGYVGFLDTSEFMDKRVVRVVTNGVCERVYNKLLEVYEESDVPDYIIAANEDEKGNIRVGICSTASIIHKSRLSRTKVFDGKVDVEYLYGLSVDRFYTFMSNPGNYLGKVRKLTDTVYEDIEFEDSRYAEYMYDEPLNIAIEGLLK